MQVKQIVNMFGLMNFFITAGRSLTLRDIVEEFGWPRSSAFNVVSTLVDLGYLHQPVPRGGYFPTSKWRELANDLEQSQPLSDSVYELLEELMEETGETVILSGASGDRVVFLAVVESKMAIRYTATVGERIPIHMTSAGRAILSQYSETERANLLKKIDYKSYEKGPFMSPEAVERDLKESAKNGWYVNIANYDHGLAGIAVPFPYRNHRYSIVVGAPVSRVERKAARLGKTLRKHVQAFLKTAPSAAE